jgi:hypothetical protein
MTARCASAAPFAICGRRIGSLDSILAAHFEEVAMSKNGSRLGAFAGLLVVCVSALGQEQKGKDALQPETEWIGIQYFQPIQGQKGQDSVRLKITSRDGDKFEAEYWLSAAKEKRGLRLEGTITKGTITCKATRILGGKGWRKGILDVVWGGSLKEKDKQLQLFRTHTDGSFYQIDFSLDDK